MPPFLRKPPPTFLKNEGIYPSRGGFIFLFGILNSLGLATGI